MFARMRHVAMVIVSPTWTNIHFMSANADFPSMVPNVISVSTTSFIRFLFIHSIIDILLKHETFPYKRFISAQ